jgi:adenylate cyclase
MDAAEQLEILREVDGIADRARDLSQLRDELGRSLAAHLGAERVLISRTGPPEDLGLPDDTPDSLRELIEALSARSDAWEEDERDGWIARPLRPDGRTVGIVCVLKSEGLSERDRAAWKVFDERADSAMVHAIEREALRDRTRELVTIYEIDHIRDEHLEFGAMLQRIMERILELVPTADSALVALRELLAPADHMQIYARARQGERQSTARFLSERRDAVVGMVERAFANREMLVDRVPGTDREAVCVPLILDEEILGGFVLSTDEGQRFTTRDKRLFGAVCSQADTAIFEDVQRQRLKNVFKRYVAPDVFSELLKRDDEDFLKGRRRRVSVFFSDLRGFTSVSEQLDVDVVVRMLNEHLDAMTQVVFEHGGTVDKFIGDCVMAFFGAPLYMPDHAARAVKCAIAMRARHDEIAAEWEKRGLPGVKMGVGMHSGEVFVGNIGGDSLTSYTVIGDHVNLASRLEGESGPDDIIISDATLAAIGEDQLDLEERGEVTVKGKTVPVKIFNVRGAK